MNGAAKRAVYVDPLWAVDERGEVDPTRGTVERDVFGDRVHVQFGITEKGTYVREGERLESLVRGADALVISRAQITPQLVDALLPSCKVVARAGIGFDNLNPPLLRERGIIGFNIPDFCVDEVSTHTLAMLLALERRIGPLDRSIKGGRWDTYEGPPPRRQSQLTLGIVGFGTIGRATARRAGAFYKRMIAYDPYVLPDLMAGHNVGKIEDLAELVAQSDAVAVHALLNAQTLHLIDEAALERMRPGTMLVNTARGGLVKPEAILAALADGRLGGYGSDVFTPEDPNQHPANKTILTFPNVLVTPHTAFRSVESERSQRKRVAEGVLHVLETGQPPEVGHIC
ncbi:MAG: hypothetical protein NVSMB64_20550 [Candidatus Velthaea sp.]